MFRNDNDLPDAVPGVDWIEVYVIHRQRICKHFSESVRLWDKEHVRERYNHCLADAVALDEWLHLRDNQPNWVALTGRIRDGHIYWVNARVIHAEQLGDCNVVRDRKCDAACK